MRKVSLLSELLQIRKFLNTLSGKEKRNIINNFDVLQEKIQKNKDTRISYCENCGETFEYYSSEKPGKYCPDCVSNTQYREAPEQKIGKENHRYCRIKVECNYCENELEKTLSRVEKQENHYCNSDCYSEWRKENQYGESNPNFKDGRSKSDLYIGNWSKNKKKILKESDYCCENCGKGKDKIGRNPDVHHIVPIREFDNPKVGNRTENLKALCPECHYEEERE